MTTALNAHVLCRLHIRTTEGAGEGVKTGVFIIADGVRFFGNRGAAPARGSSSSIGIAAAGAGSEGPRVSCSSGRAVERPPLMPGGLAVHARARPYAHRGSPRAGGDFLFQQCGPASARRLLRIPRSPRGTRCVPGNGCRSLAHAGRGHGEIETCGQSGNKTEVRPSRKTLPATAVSATLRPSGGG